MANNFRQQTNSSISRYIIIDSPGFGLIASCIAHDRYVLIRCEDGNQGIRVRLEEAYSDQRRAEAALDDWMKIAGEDEWFELLYPMN